MSQLNESCLLPGDDKESIELTSRKNSSRLDSTEATADEPVLGAGCSSLYTTKDPSPSNSQNPDEATSSSAGSGLQMKDITRPGTPMPARFSREGSSHDRDSKDYSADIIAGVLSELAPDVHLSPSLPGCGDETLALGRLPYARVRSRQVPRRTPGIRRRRGVDEQDLGESFSLLFSEQLSDHGGSQHRTPNHLAKTHDDTSAGAVHRYQDEHGTCYTHHQSLC